MSIEPIENNHAAEMKEVLEWIEAYGQGWGVIDLLDKYRHYLDKGE